MYFNIVPAIRFITNILENEKNSGLDRDPFLKLLGVTSMDQFDPKVFRPIISFRDGSHLSHVMRTSFLVSEGDYTVEYWLLIHKSKDNVFTLQTYSAYEMLPALIGK